MKTSSSVKRAQTIEAPQGTPGRILAIDYGRKKMGLALSDPLRLSSQPFTTLLRTNRGMDLRTLREICREQKVNLIVVGNPIHLNGEPSAMASEASRFARRLSKNLGIAVELADERLTTWESHDIVRALGGKRKERPVDEVAAAILLRDYLEKTSHTDAARSAAEAGE